MRDYDTLILANRRPAGVDDCRRLLLRRPAGFTPRPGQFIQIEVNRAGTDPLLRRPFSIADLQPETVTVIYRVQGRGTARLAERRRGEAIRFLGPLGKDYPAADGPCLLVAGGMGAAGLLFLARRLAELGRAGSATLLLGCRDRNGLFFRTAFQKLGVRTVCATEDGSAGRAGLVTDLLRNELNRDRKPVVYACGPAAMLAGVHEATRGTGIRAYVSLETVMACGSGLCRGCAVPTRAGYRMACTDGPVFAAEEIDWKAYVENA
ncbi:MAG TPA: dihydroorotate dehydrogenase electron transfer subunit [bacterium]|nr:dihydroorotate dehydrogenase electron transfer subunit [bacterium]HNS48095.1 dihydroorotate dehydrogenase electron transfer subunit [bacterium]